MVNQNTLGSSEYGYGGLAKSLYFALEIDTGLAQEHWSDSDCVYSFADDHEPAQNILYSIVSSWKKPEGHVSPFWYLNKIVQKSPLCVSWTKVGHYLDKCRYRHERLLPHDRRAFAESYPYIMVKIKEAIQAERNDEAAQKSETVAERNHRLFKDAVKLLIAQPDSMAKEIRKALFDQELGRSNVSDDLLKRIVPLHALKKEIKRRKVK